MHLFAPRLLSRPLRLGLTALCLFAVLPPGTATAQATAQAGRVALVIGNADYRHSDPVPNARADVGVMLKLLAAADFQVRVLSNVSRARLGEELVHFSRRARGAELALIYYSGHTIQVDGRNYVVPVDAAVEDELSFSRDLLSLENMVLELNGARQGLLLLDASRRNRAADRFRASVRVRTVGTGLAPLRYRPRNTVVALSTAPGQESDDRGSGPSRYTAALVEALSTPGIDVMTALRRAGERVRERSAGAQRPWILGELPSELVLVPTAQEPETRTAALAAAAPTPAPAPPTNGPETAARERPPATAAEAPVIAPADAGPVTLREDQAAFEKAYAEHSIAAYQAFISAFPDSPYVANAQVLLAKLAAKAPAVPTPQTPQFSDFRAGQDGRVSLRTLAPGTRFRDCRQCPEMVMLPTGAMVMGSPESEPKRYANESPQHPVRIDYPLAVARFELTYEQWQACVEAGGCGEYLPDDDGWGRGPQPVIGVSWADAQQYVSWLSARTRRKYRLLSEAEWEYAARAGTRTPFYTGACIDSDDANFNASRPYADCTSTARSFPRRPQPVGSYPANAWGLHDLAGNVWEWTQDCYNDSYQGAPQDGRPWLDGDCTFRVSRGGGFLSRASDLRSAYRNGFSVEERSGSIGFRVATSE